MIGKVNWQKLGQLHMSFTWRIRSFPGVWSPVCTSPWGRSNVSAWRTNAIYRRSRFLRRNLAKAETGLGKARAGWQLTRLRSALLAPHLLGKSGEGLGKDANVLDVKVQSRAPLTLRLLGENPSTMLASHSVCDWISILCMHRGALPSDNNAEPSVSYHGVVMTYCEKSRAWGR